MRIQQSILRREEVDHMVAVRRAIHANPELSHGEIETRLRIVRELASADLVDLTGVGPVGFAVDVVGRKNGVSRTVGIRADLDALPIHEAASVPFRSARSGVMHACGHDSHTAMVLEAGLWLQRHAEVFSGRVRLLFQHSEESLPSGAREFVAAGLAADMDIVLGIHVDPLIEAGLVTAQPGAFACSSDHFDVVVSGKSSHGGRPHEGIDALATAATLLLEINKISAHNADPMVPLVVTAGCISGGTAHNVIADSVSIGGTIRAGGQEVREIAHQRLREISRGLEAMHGVRVDVTFAEDAPLLSNDKEVADLVRRAATKVAGNSEILSDAPMWSASDDFAYFSNEVPGTYFRIGVRNEAKGFVYPLHHPEFAIDEDALAIGAAVLIQSTLDALVT